MVRVYKDGDDRNKKEEMPTFYIELLNDEPFIDNVSLYEIFDRESLVRKGIKLISITDDTITIECDGIQKTIKNGKILQ